MTSNAQLRASIASPCRTWGTRATQVCLEDALLARLRHELVHRAVDVRDAELGSRLRLPVLPHQLPHALHQHPFASHTGAVLEKRRLAAVRLLWMHLLCPRRKSAVRTGRAALPCSLGCWVLHDSRRPALQPHPRPALRASLNRLRVFGANGQPPRDCRTPPRRRGGCAGL